MAKTRPPYTPEFRRQMVELVRAGRSPEELAQEFEPTAQSIRNWVGQSECDAGTRRQRAGDGRSARNSPSFGVRTASSGSRGISSQKPRPGLLGRRTRSHRRVPVRERESGRLPDRHHVPAAGCLPQRLLCVDEAATVAAYPDRRRAGRGDPCRARGFSWHLWGAAHSCRSCGQRHSRRSQAGRSADVRRQVLPA